MAIAWLPLALALLTAVSTSLGGVFALRYRRQLPLFMAFGAGVLVATAVLDMLPEAVATSSNLQRPLDALLAGFVIFYLVEKVTVLHACRELDCDSPRHSHQIGVAGAAGFSVHSFLDGAAIGLAFQAGSSVGATVAFAVLAHDFVDGLNTVTVLLANGNSLRASKTWLGIDALAPLAGAVIAQLIRLPAVVLGPVLALFAGLFLYIGGSDLLPEAHERRESGWTLAMTLAGVAAFLVMRRLLP